MNIQTLADLGSNIHIFAITGGPCSGKSSGMARLNEYLSSRGYKVLIVPEAATKFILGGITPGDPIPVEVFQSLLLRDIINQEQVFWDAAKHYRDLGYKVVVLCDRGVLDGEAYVTPEIFARLVERLDTDLATLSNQRYHAVFHLRSAACGAEEFYTRANNAARTETVSEAREKDAATLRAWQRHQHIRVVDNSTGFEEKMRRLIAEICTVLGDPEPVEHERKFVVRRTDLLHRVMESVGHIHVSSITQHYLRDSGRVCSRRLRQRCDPGGVTYFYTEKTYIGPGKHVEIERILSPHEYQVLIHDVDPDLYPIEKNRHVFFVDGVCYELDIFKSERLEGLVYLEVEMTSATSGNSDTQVVMPDILQDLELVDVTDIPGYSNRDIASKDWKQPKVE